VRYLIIGAGAIGATIGAMLVESGQDVILVARGSHLNALRRDGLHLDSPRGVLALQIPAIGGPAEINLRPDDVLLLCVKSQDTEAALAAWADRPVAGGGVAADRLPIVCAQNGVDNERAALRRFANVYGMCVLLPATHLEPGRAVAFSDPVVGALVLGRYPSGTDEVAEVIGKHLAAARLLAPVVPDVPRWKYAKLLRNLGNAVEAVCGPMAENADAERLSALALAEGASVLAAAGIEVATDAEMAGFQDQLTWQDLPGRPRGGGSSWQSLTRGVGTIESDYLNGEIVMLGRLNGVPVPVNSLLLRLADRAAATGQKPGSITAAQILAQLEPG
jgi:2-dehydropantoate 2-reductase